MSGVPLLTIEIFCLVFSLILMIEKNTYVSFAKLSVIRKTSTTLSCSRPIPAQNYGRII